MSIADQLATEVQRRVNAKTFDHFEERDKSKDFVGNLSAKRFWVNGNTRGSSVEVLDANKPLLEITLDIDWKYKRKQYRGVQPPIEEDRSDTGKYIFEVTADLFNGMVISEKKREASVALDHDSARIAFIGLLEDIIRPSFKIK